MNKEIELAINELAIDSIGLYPQTMIDEKGIRIERTEWQNGWNSALMEFRNRAIIFTNWFSNLPENLSTIIGELLIKETIRLSLNKDKKITMWVLMNDTFYFACADGEDIIMDEIPLLYQMWKKFDWYGLVAFISKKRKRLPLVEVQTEEFKKAFEYLNDKG